MKKSISIQAKVKAIITDTKQANKLIEILKIFENEECGDYKTIKHAINGASKVFSHFLESADFRLNKTTGHTEANSIFVQWILDKLDVFKNQLLDLLFSQNVSIQTHSLVSLLNITAVESRRYLSVEKPTSSDIIFLHRDTFKKLLLSLCHPQRNMGEAIGRFTEYLMFDDVRLLTLRLLFAYLTDISDKVAEGPMLKENVFALLESVSGAMSPDQVADDGKLTNYFAPHEKYREDCWVSVRSIRRAFDNAWAEFLSKKISYSLYRKTLIILHEKVIPHMENPLLLADFLTTSYDAGGAVSLLALNGLFVLMTKYNLDYPDFYTKLYAMLAPGVFHVKYRARFFHLLDVFLSSSHLPAYLVAAFVKRLARLSLTASPDGALLAAKLAANLLRRHRICVVLVNRPTPEDDDLRADPYDSEEADMTKCGALDSSLWEFRAMQSHYEPQVRAAMAVFGRRLGAAEENLDSALNTRVEDMIERECKKHKAASTKLSDIPPKSLFQYKFEKVSKIFQV